MKIRPNNKGLTVKVNLWSMEKAAADLDEADAREKWLKGQVIRNGDKKATMFKNVDQLISILREWNVEQLRKLKLK